MSDTAVARVATDKVQFALAEPMPLVALLTLPLGVAWLVPSRRVRTSLTTTLNGRDLSILLARLLAQISCGQLRNQSLL
ncbi:hypothetical protein B4Q13_21100 [Lacticaseibacillus rhamnosus]